MIKQLLRTKQKGFTLVELTIAIAIFGMVLVIISVAIFGIIKIYRSSIAQRDTQINAHFAMDTMVRDIRSAQGITKINVNGCTASCPTIPPNPRFDQFCVQTDLLEGYRYYVHPLSKQLHRVSDSIPATCSPGSTGEDASSDQTFTADTVQILDLQIVEYNTGGSGVGAKISIIVGSKSGIVIGETTCQAAKGSEFCSVTGLETSVAIQGGG